MKELKKTKLSTILKWILGILYCVVIWEYSITLDPIGSDDLVVTKHDNNKRTVVVYTGPTSLKRTVGKNELYLANFEYFLRHKGIDCDYHDTILTLSDETYNYYLGKENTILGKLQETCGTALKVIRRDDTCYDLGSVHLVFNTIDLSKYDYFVYLNCGVVGPLWWNENSNALSNTKSSSIPWTHFFTSLLNQKVKMSGLSVNCRNTFGFDAHIQTMAYALDREGLDIVKSSGVVYDCKKLNNAMTLRDKQLLIHRYEVGMSTAIFAQGFSISSWIWSFRAGNSHRPIVVDSQSQYCRDVWNVDPFLRISGGHKAMNLTFFKTSRFIPPNILKEVGYNVSNSEMKYLVNAFHKGLTMRTFAMHTFDSAFVE